MPSKQEAKDKIAAAEEGCTKVMAAWYVAHKTLGGGVKTNAYGVYSDRVELQSKLDLAIQKLIEARDLVGAIQWPTTNDYDLI